MSPRKSRRRGHSPLSPANLEAVARRFRALGSPSRLRILNALMDGPLAMADLADQTELEQSNLSRHVAALEAAGCVRRTRNGREVDVEISDPTLAELCDLVCGAVETRAAERLAAIRGG